ncbi:type I polyketide synthase [Altericista sp. CCNU0014]|uniref:type I polyketide synthase n=1 Tax=Altericista sp. CCNU0014 TaxID=3082949 RepID=UPI00384E7D53
MEKVAVIGMGCRFPGARNLDEFWRLLLEETDAVTEVPPDRWDIDAFYDPQPGKPGKMSTRWGGFLEQVDSFDPQFFGIAPREAVYMDPQQRLLMEVAWESLEQAGQVPEQLARTQTGVFIGISSNDYQQVLQGNGRVADINAYLGTGNAFSIAANRLSYFFDFRGPSLAIDTACSSSLVAVHLACQSLRSGESDLALAGGVNLLLRPEVTVIFSQAQMMAPDGRCKTFDARANGYVRGEGCGTVVLKRLQDALRDGDRILATIRGSAINQDGHSNGITAPNGPAQEAVLRRALANAEATPAEIGYVELHGTGTSLGDPIEAEALGNVLAQGRSPGDRCAVGSVKTNIGHLEAAAGIAGLIKVVLALQHRQIPASLHFQQPNPYIPLAKLPLQVQTTLEPWPGEGAPALAGVSSFGFGGTNAHVILEAAPEAASLASQSRQPDASAYLLPLSAKSPEALKSLAQAYRTFLDRSASESIPALQDLCYTASLRRSHHDHRLSIAFRDRSELVEKLQAFDRGELPVGLAAGQRKRSRPPKLAFVFPGQGPQWWAMGRELWHQEPAFRAVLEQCDRLLKAHTDWSLVEELLATEARSRLGETEIAQPALFALQVALVALWQSWGIQPSAVVGHSLGEVAAAYTAGALSLEAAIQVVYHRGRLMQQGTGHGKMAAVELSPAEAEARLAAYGGQLAIAAINSPTSVVLSGELAALDAILLSLQQENIFAKLLPVNYAFHSPQMEPFQDELVRFLQRLQPQAPAIPMLSTVTGQAVRGETLDAIHWSRNIREPVQFAPAIAQLIAQKHILFLEISPHPVLSAYISQNLRDAGQEGVVLPSLRRQTDERATMLSSLGALYTRGYPVDWSKLYPQGGRCVALPNYPWQRSRYWVDATPGSRSDRPSETAIAPSSGPENGRVRPQVETPEPLPESLLEPLEEISWGLSRQELLAVESSDRPQRIRAFYQALLAKVMGVSETQVETPLFSLGLDSIMGFELYRQTELTLGVAIPLEEFPGLSASRFVKLVLEDLESPQSAKPALDLTLGDRPSPRTAALRNRAANANGTNPSSDSNWLFFPKPQPQASLRLFCLPYAGAGASIFRSWAEALPPGVEVCAIQLPGREDRLGETPLTRIGSLVQRLVPILQPHLEIPFAIFGHSMGGLVGFELVRELRRQNCALPTHLFASGIRAPQLPDLNLPIHRLPEPQFLEALQKLQGTPEAILQNAELMKLLSPTIRADLAIAENYIYAAEEKLLCPITAFGGQQDPLARPEDLSGWKDQTLSDFALHVFPTDHFFLHRDRDKLLEAIAATLTQPLSLKS